MSQAMREEMDEMDEALWRARSSNVALRSQVEALKNERDELVKGSHAQALEIATLKRQLSTVMGHPHTPQER